jgi:hypothetical protein
MNREKRDLLVHVLWNKTQDTKFWDKCEELKKELDKIHGIQRSFFTKDSDVSDIAALAQWTNDEIKDRVAEIKQIKNVSDVDVRILVPA